MKNVKLILNKEEVEFLEKVLNYTKSKAKDENSLRLIKEIDNKISRNKKLNDHKYLIGLDKDSLDHFLVIKDEYGIDLYHSLMAIIHIKKFNTSKDLFNYYSLRYKIERPLVFKEKELFLKIIDFIMQKYRNKNSKIKTEEK